MLLRYWLSGPVSLPRPLDTGGAQLAIATALNSMAATDTISVAAFGIENVYADAAARVSDTTRVAAEVGKIFQQQSDDTYWTLSAVTSGAAATWTAFTLTKPSSGSGGAGGGGGGGSSNTVTRGGAAVTLSASVWTGNSISLSTGQYIIFTPGTAPALGTQVTSAATAPAASTQGVGWTGTNPTTTGITLTVASAPTNYSGTAMGAGSYIVYYNVGGTTYAAPFTLA